MSILGSLWSENQLNLKMKDIESKSLTVNPSSLILHQTKLLVAYLSAPPSNPPDKAIALELDVKKIYIGFIK